MIRWSEFFCPDEARAAEVVRSLGARLLGSDGGPPASAGELRDPQALFDPARFGDGTRPAHITSPTPLVHPRLRAHVAELLGFTAAQVAAVARLDTCVLGGAVVEPERLRELDHDDIADHGGGAELRRLLVARTGRGDLVLDHVPVLPPRERPPATSDAGEPVPGAIDRAYERLLAALALYRRYLELDAPCVMRMAQWERAQDSFDSLCAAIAGEPEPHMRPFALDDAWLAQNAAALAHSRGDDEGRVAVYFDHLHAALRPAPPTPPIPRHGHHVDPLTPLACRFVGDDALLLVLPHAVLVIDAATGDLRLAAPAPTSDIVLVTATAGHALFVGRGDLLAHVHALDLRRGVYLDSWDSLTPPLFPMAPYKHDAWCLYDYGRRLAHPLPDPGNTKAGAVLGPCLRHAWIEGTTRIFRLADMLPQFDLAALPRMPAPPGYALWRRGEQPPEIADDDPQVFPWIAPSEPSEPDEPGDPDEYDDDVDLRVAFALAADGFRVFWQGALFVGRAPVLRLGRPFASVALDRAGERLLVGYPGELVVHPLAADGQPQAARRLSLARHADAVTLSALRGRVPGLTREVEMQLLAHFGTVAELRRASVEALASTSAFAPMLEPEFEPIAAELARSIHDALHAL